MLVVVVVVVGLASEDETKFLSKLGRVLVTTSGRGMAPAIVFIRKTSLICTWLKNRLPYSFKKNW